MESRVNIFNKLFGSKAKPEESQLDQSEQSADCHTKQALIEQYGGFALEKQDNLANLIGELPWNANLDDGEIRFGDNLFFPIQILGTFSHSSQTWLWAWANSQSNIPQNLLQQALTLKQYGENHGIDLLSNDTVGASETDLHFIGLIASGMFNSSGYYLADYGEGILCVTISSADIDRSFSNDHLAIMTIFPQLIALYEMNHKNALTRYLQQKGYQIQAGENQLTATKGDKTIRAEFDQLSRMTQLNGRL